MASRDFGRRLVRELALCLQILATRGFGAGGHAGQHELEVLVVGSLTAGMPDNPADVHVITYGKDLREGNGDT